MATPADLSLAILRDMEKSLDDTERNSRVEARIKSALDAIAVATDWNMFRTRTTFNTVAGTAVYQLPVGGREINQLRYTDTGDPIVLWTTQSAARHGAKLEDDGRARTWIEDGNLVSGSNVLYQFRLAPVPDDELEIEVEYFYHPSAIASASTMPIQDQYIEPVKCYVRAALHRLDQRYDAANLEMREYKELLAQLVKTEKRKVAMQTRMRPSDIRRGNGRGQPMFDPAHFHNEWI